MAAMGIASLNPSYRNCGMAMMGIAALNPSYKKPGT